MAEKIDQKIKQWATELQAQYIDAMNETGSISGAARKCGVERSTVRRGIELAQRKAAAHGHAPGHFNDGVAPGYRMGKVTIQRSAAGVERVWERQHPEDEKREETVQAIARAAMADLKPLEPVECVRLPNGDLVNLITITDYHLGMRAHANETGADWDLEIAEASLYAAFDDLLIRSPAAETLVINIPGDFFHFDSIKPVTPTHGHVLSAASSYSGMVEAGFRMIRRVAQTGLELHQFVTLVLLPGNHDLSTMIATRHAFSILYENEPRITVLKEERSYAALEFGVTMLAIHHGHMKKKESLPLLFAAMFSEIWGRTKKRYAHVGHLHHEVVQEASGMKTTQHPTFSAPDDHAINGGWLSERQMSLITYSKTFGKVSETITTPEMLGIPNVKPTTGAGKLGLR